MRFFTVMSSMLLFVLAAAFIAAPAVAVSSGTAEWVCASIQEGMPGFSSGADINMTVDGYYQRVVACTPGEHNYPGYTVSASVTKIALGDDPPDVPDSHIYCTGTTNSHIYGSDESDVHNVPPFFLHVHGGQYVVFDPKVYAAGHENNNNFCTCEEWSVSFQSTLVDEDGNRAYGATSIIAEPGE